ncbi:MAG: aconitase family protein [Candidatus Zixiibacteriota bacterium]
MSARKRIPTKSELVRLQKLYKTDEKIGERLGGVPAYLIAYWRRKKNVPKHSLPKFSEKEIRDLWERFGDDDKCGLELGISKAAFYNWRRRYGIREKPAFLKLEQLELNFPGLKLHPTTNSLYGKKTVSQKIMARAAQLERLEIGQTIEVEPDLIVSHSDTETIIEHFKKLGSELVWNPGRIVVSLADGLSAERPDLPAAHQKIREFVKRQGIKSFYDVSEGVGHQVALERGHIIPGAFVVGTDPYSVAYGCVSAFSSGVTVEQAAEVWATGTAKFQIPPTIRIDINGRRARGVYARDIALLIARQMAAVDVKGKTIEYYGNVVSRMSISERYTLTNLTLDAGVLTAICPFDSTTRRFLTGRISTNYAPVVADKNAEYHQIYQMNIDHLTPQLARCGEATDITPVGESEGLAVNVIILGTGSNGRFDDIRVAADILKNKRVSSDCRLIICPASRSVYLEALKKGLIRVLVEAGAIVTYPGYWGSLGQGQLMIAPGDRVLATSDCGLAQRLGSDKAEIFLCSPGTAAASALNGSITDPSRYAK